MTKPTEPTTPRETKPANKRGAARLAAVQALYQMEIAGGEIGDVVTEFEVFRLGREVDGEGDEYREADSAFFREIVAGVVAHQRQIDPLVHQTLTEGWPLKRIDVTLREILRAGTFEILKRKDIPARVVINEYVDVAKAFFVEDEPKIVNGVLDKIAHDLRPTDFEA